MLLKNIHHLPQLHQKTIARSVIYSNIYSLSSITSSSTIPSTSSTNSCNTTIYSRNYRTLSLSSIISNVRNNNSNILFPSMQTKLSLSSSSIIRSINTTTTTYQISPNTSSSSPSSSPSILTNNPNELPLDDIILTPRAVQRIKFLQNKANNSISNTIPSSSSSSPSSSIKTLYLRVKVDGGGCSGFKYDFTIEYNDAPNINEDRIFTRDGSSVIIDTVSLDLLRGSVIDYEEGLLKASFVVASNPNAESSCGCKASFAVKEK